MNSSINSNYETSHFPIWDFHKRLQAMRQRREEFLQYLDKKYHSDQISEEENSNDSSEGFQNLDSPKDIPQYNEGNECYKEPENECEEILLPDAVVEAHNNTLSLHANETLCNATLAVMAENPILESLVRAAKALAVTMAVSECDGECTSCSFFVCLPV